jgi:NADPH:quinone reductase
VRALVLREATGPAALSLEERPDPEPVPGLVAVDVHAAGAGFVDLLITKGEYQLKPDLPFVPGTEVAGVVAAVPEGSALAVGQRVAALTFSGGFAERALVPEVTTFPLPDAVGFPVAAAAVTNVQTAHLGLLRRGRLAPGDGVLVLGAGGGVGVAAIAVARAAGAGTIVGVASTPERRALALEAGADVALDGTQPWVEAAREALGGRGADLVVDPVGGDGFVDALRATATFGRVLVVGFASGTIPEVRVNRLLLRSIDVVGVNLGGLLAVDPAFAREAWDELAGWLADGTLALPGVVEHPWERAPEVLAAFGERAVVGKPVLRVR